MAKKKVSSKTSTKPTTKSSTKTTKSVPKKNNSLTIGLVVGAFIIIALIVIGVSFFNSEDAPAVIEPVVNETPVVEEPVEVVPEVIVPEKFDLSPLEKEVLNQIRNKRQVFSLDRYVLNFDLCEQLRNHTIEMARTGDVSSIDQFSDSTKRAKAAGVSVKIIESNQKVVIAEGADVANAIFEKLPKQNLYLNDYTHIALSISEGDNNEYYVTLDLYKVDA